MLADLHKKSKIIFRVYKNSVIFISFLLTGAFTYVVINNKAYESFPMPIIMMARVIVLIPVLYLFYELRKKEFMYYRNLGISKWQLLSGIFVIDIIFAYIVMIAAYII